MEVAAKTSRTYAEDYGNHGNLNEVSIDGKVIPVVVDFNGQYRVTGAGIEGFGKSVTAAKFHFVSLYRAKQAGSEQ